jgi:hypothetical protein
VGTAENFLFAVEPLSIRWRFAGVPSSACVGHSLFSRVSWDRLAEEYGQNNLQRWISHTGIYFSTPL